LAIDRADWLFRIMHGALPMPRIAGFARYLILVLIAIPATLFAAPSEPTGAPQPASLKGQLLIATPAIRDPRFERAVILMVWHDRDGAFGIVINRPLGEKPLVDILAAFGKKDVAAAGNVPVFLGGPVQPEVSFVIHGTDYRRPATHDINARLAVTPTGEAVEDMARNGGPAQHLIAFGYAGWGQGQLEDELSRNAWYTAPAEPGIVFEEPRDKVWERATARRTQDL
jgi:putative transcriptional regulator